MYYLCWWVFNPGCILLFAWFINQWYHGAMIFAIISTYMSCMEYQNVTVCYGMAQLQFLMGLTAAMQFAKGRPWWNALGWEKRAVIGGIAACITIGTIIFVPSYRIITFGAVHCIFWVSCLMMFFLQIPYIGAAIGLAIHLMWATDFWTPMPEKWIFMSPGSSLDYHELFMNLPYALYGIAAFHLKLHEGDVLTRWHNNGFFLQRLWLLGYDKANPVEKLGPHYRWEDHTISWIGKRSLEVYVTHQIIAFPFVFVLSHIIYLFAHHVYGHHE
jgi:hypothetical protein